MLRKLRPQLSYANVASTLALVLAIGGGSAYAVTKISSKNIRRHAVTSSKVAPNAITASKVANGALSGNDIRDNSITTDEVRNGALLATDFAAGQVPKGEKGEKGDPATSIYGVVTADGGLTNQKNVTAVSPGTAGLYTATINQDVSRCAVVATLRGGDAGTVTAQPKTGSAPADAQQITFQTRNDASVATPRGFQFAVYC